MTAGSGLSAISLNGYLLGLPDEDEERGPEQDSSGEGDKRGRSWPEEAGESLLDDGSIVSGGNIDLAGVGAYFAKLTAAGNVTVTAYGIDPSPTMESWAAERAAWAADAPDLDDGGPDMVDALFGPTDLHANGSAATPNTADMLFDLNDALLDLTHFQYTLTTTPKHMANLMTPLHDVGAGLPPDTADDLAEHPQLLHGLDS